MMAERQAMLVTSGKPIPAAALSVADTMMRVAISAVVVSAVYWLTEGIFGRGLGKLILGLRIGGGGRPAPAGGGAGGGGGLQKTRRPPRGGGVRGRGGGGGEGRPRRPPGG